VSYHEHHIRLSVGHCTFHMEYLAPQCTSISDIASRFQDAVVDKSTVRDGGTDEDSNEVQQLEIEGHSLYCSREPKGSKTYNSWYSLVVTHPTTNQPIMRLSTGERTGSPVFSCLWSYVSA
jgi:hypothetical protein